MSDTKVGNKQLQNPWVEQTEHAPNPMAVPMENPSVAAESKAREEILANLLIHFWHGYRKLRDTLTELENAIEAGHRQQAASLLQQIKRFAGCSFRYEREAVLPALRQRIGDECIHEFKAAHDQAMQIVRRLEEFLSHASDETGRNGQSRSMIRTLMVGLAFTAGLTLLIETLPREELIKILQARERALVEGKDLYE